MCKSVQVWSMFSLKFVAILVTFLFQSKWFCIMCFWYKLIRISLCIKNLYSFVQSICTHYSCFENVCQFVTLKKIRSEIWTWKKARCKKGYLFFFWILMTLLFAPSFFQVHILNLIFFKFQTLKMSGWPDFFKVPDTKKTSVQPDKLE